jgi:hypothetical protein
MKTIAITFGGRECSLSILFKYILKYRKYIDEYRIYVATIIQSDIDYMTQFALNNDFVKLVYVTDADGKIILNDKNRIWDEAYKQCQEDDCVYLKFDDDIVYFDETLFTNFLKYRIENEEAPLLFPTIINNCFFSWMFELKQIYTPSKNKSTIGATWPNTYNRIKPIVNSNKSNTQLKIGKITYPGEVLCPSGWGNLEYCVNLHNQFLSDLNHNHIEKYRLGQFKLLDRHPVSISCCAWLGKRLKQITQQVGDVFDDEPWLTIWMPTWLDTYNEVYGDCIVGHYAYYRQRELGLDNTGILDMYRSVFI